MWAHAWRGGILQNVRGVVPGHVYRLSAYGFFQPEGAPAPEARIGIDPCGTLADQYSVDVTRHPAPKYDEGVGDDAKTPERDGPDVADTTVWSDYKDYYRWGRFEVTAEARSDTITAILYCDPQQRPAEKPIYEMNWDTVAMYEVPWPAKRLAVEDAEMAVDQRLSPPVITIQPDLGTAQVTWRTKMPAGAAQVLYRFLDSEAVNHQAREDGPDATTVRGAGFPLKTPVVYERSVTSHWVEIEPCEVPDAAEQIQAVALSRALIEGKCQTLCSPVGVLKLR
jgi:hypothetical protein